MKKTIMHYNIITVWSNCIGKGVDNTSVNLGVRNSIRTHVLQKHP